MPCNACAQAALGIDDITELNATFGADCLDGSPTYCIDGELRGLPEHYTLISGRPDVGLDADPGEVLLTPAADAAARLTADAIITNPSTCREMVGHFTLAAAGQVTADQGADTSVRLQRHYGGAGADLVITDVIGGVDVFAPAGATVVVGGYEHFEVTLAPGATTTVQAGVSFATGNYGPGFTIVSMRVSLSGILSTTTP